jgi:hypothetical protein
MSGHLSDGLGEDVDDAIEVLLSDVERREQTQYRAGGAIGQDSLLAHAVHDGGPVDGICDFDPYHQAPTPYIAYRVAGLGFVDPFHGPASELRRPFGEALLFDGLEGGQGRGAGQRIATEGRSVVPG